MTEYEFMRNRSIGNKKIILLCSVAMFVATTVISTITAARVDRGSTVNVSPADGGPHIMSLGEAVWHNLPPAIIEGIVFAVIFAAVIYAAGRYIDRRNQELMKRSTTSADDEGTVITEH